MGCGGPDEVLSLVGLNKASIFDSLSKFIKPSIDPTGRSIMVRFN